MSYLLLGDVVLLIRLCLSFPGLDKDTVKQGLDMVFSGLFIQGNRLMWD